MPSVQKRNSELVDLLSADFVGRADTTFVMAMLLGTVMQLPGLYMYHPLSAITLPPAVVKDVGPNHCDLNYAGAGANIISTAFTNYFWNTTTGYLVRTANDAYNLGFTCMAWIYTNADATQYVITKSGQTTPTYQWGLNHYITTRALRLFISADGTNIQAVQSANNALPVNKWTFVAFGFNPSVNLFLWVNDTYYSTATASAATFNGTVPMQLSGLGGNAWWLTGAIAQFVMCRTALADGFIKNYYYLSRHIFDKFS